MPDGMDIWLFKLRFAKRLYLLENIAEMSEQEFERWHARGASPHSIRWTAEWLEVGSSDSDDDKRFRSCWPGFDRSDDDNEGENMIVDNDDNKI